MKQERMKILELLDQGKITAAEAANLLDAIKSGASGEGFWDEDAAKRVQEKMGKFTQNVESVSKDVGDKLEAIFKEVEPKLRAATKVVVEKTSIIVDEISKTLNETLKNLDEQCCDCGCADECCTDGGDKCCADAGAEPCRCDENPPEN